MAGRRSFINVTIPSASTTSDAATISSGTRLVGFVTPAAFTGSNVSFQTSVDAGVSFQPVYNAGSVYSVAVGTSRFVAIDPDVFIGAGYIKIVSDGSEAAARTVTLVISD